MGETMRSQFLEEIQYLRTALDSYEDRIASWNEEELEEERQTFFTRTITSMQNDTVLDDGAPQFMAPRAKKPRAGVASKSELVAAADQELCMLLGMLAGSRDPDVVAAANSLSQQKENALVDPMAVFSNAVAGCTEQEIEKIITAACGRVSGWLARKW